MTIGGVGCSGIGEPFSNGLGIRCTFRAIRVMCQDSNSVDPAAGLANL